MKIRGLGRLRQIARRLRNRFEPGGLILLYHRVAEVDSDPWSLCVTPQHFAEHLDVLRKHGCPMQLQQLIQGLQDGKLANRSVSITFDDGYADNLHNAKPLLDRYNIPATVFLTSGYIGHEREFWWDELERLLLQPGTLPETLRLSINSKTYQWELGEAADYTEDAYQHHCYWQFEHEDTPSQRHALYRSLYQLLCSLRAGDRQKVLDELLVWSSAEPANRPTHRCLSLAEAIALEQGGLIEVGSHTVTHPLLSTLPLSLQQDEIEQSKARLEEIVGHAVSSFAYPHGNYTAETATLVRQAGFACACSTAADTVWQHTDCFQLPRVVVEDWDGEEFARRLKEWFHG
ncbi:polysaccharide deacetylase [Gloeocapsopsis sp. AAB1 = 1H9]|uniref:Polysaccharide deacetylase n=2 Tax=Gloeocapsopsis TaxID=693222 RepID=A0A6N8G0L6_9CHRO|nr:polysaccharide deacetylase [Gloeocapsopsis dulcis AAB1 = 1H9]